MSEDVTIRILAEIRDAVRITNQRIDELRDETNKRFDETNKRSDERVDQLREDVGHRITDMDLRQATRTAEHTAATRNLYDFLRANLDLRDRVENCEQDITVLKKKVG